MCFQVSAEKTGDASRSDVLLDQTLAMLAPLVRLLVANGVTFPQLVAALKPAFLRAAQAELSQSGKRINDSAISIVSGVHRKDVRALSSESRLTARVRQPLPSLAGEVIARWASDPQYVDQDGLPRALPVRNGNAKSEPSFERLSQSVSRDFHSRAVLEELLRLGFVEVSDDIARLHLERAVADRSFIHAMAYIARNVHDHLAAIEGNFSAMQTGNGSPHLEHSVCCGGPRARVDSGAAGIGSARPGVRDATHQCAFGGASRTRQPAFRQSGNANAVWNVLLLGARVAADA